MTYLDKLLPYKITSNQAWLDLSLAVEELVSTNIWSPTASIQTMRDPKAIESEFLSLLASLLGFQMKSDLFLESDYRRLIAGLAKYYEKSGTNYLQNFLGYIHNTQVTLVPQWTQDYHNFYDTPGGTQLYNGGTWFLTPHINFKYDLEKSGQIPVQTGRDLFYELAPIHLVLEKLIANIFAQMTVNISCAALFTVIYPNYIPSNNFNYGVLAPLRIHL